MVNRLEGINMKEYLVTGQGYAKNDQYKQTILLHDSFLTDHEDNARKLFDAKFESDYYIMNVYSIVDLTNNGY